MDIKKCKFCGAPIVWIKTQNGRSMPCNAEAVEYQDNRVGKDIVVTPEGKVIKVMVITPTNNGLIPIVDGKGYISHFATCPSANEARNRAPANAAQPNGGRREW